MTIVLIVLFSLILYYIGLVIVTKVAFKRRNIVLSITVSMLLPIFIIKTFIRVAFENKSDRKVVKKALASIFVRYEIALLILVEVIAFGFEKGMIKSANKVKTNPYSLINKFSKIRKQDRIKNGFTDSVSDYIFA